MLSVLTILISSFGLGAFHALEPGHGKTIVAAYLVGSRGRWYHALHLGIVVTITHTIGIIILGLLATYGMSRCESEQVGSWLESAAAVLIIVVGIWMFWHRLNGSPHRHSHSHHQPPAHDHNHAAGHHQRDSKNGPEHTAPAETEPAQRKRVTAWSLTLLGITGGILPCPAATAPLLYGLGSNRPALGLWAVLAFSLGLATVLVVIGLAVLHARTFVERRFIEARWLRHVPLVSAIVVTAFGLALLVKALAGPVAHAHAH
ncbi:MAG: sulfite exporter TauE/SafE family protein [Phycisphaerae bacterium]|nr:sulfite exporter TauE/SafE family protein [Phycisphaerae bacterium]